MAVDPSGRGCGQGRDGLERGESRVVHLELEQLGGAVSRGRRAVARVQPVGDVRPVTATAREVTTFQQYQTNPVMNGIESGSGGGDLNIRLLGAPPGHGRTTAGSRGGASWGTGCLEHWAGAIRPWSTISATHRGWADGASSP